MNVTFDGVAYSFNVRPGPDGYQDFAAQVTLCHMQFMHAGFRHEPAVCCAGVSLIDAPLACSFR